MDKRVLYGQRAYEKKRLDAMTALLPPLAPSPTVETTKPPLPQAQIRKKKQQSLRPSPGHLPSVSLVSSESAPVASPADAVLALNKDALQGMAQCKLKESKVALESAIQLLESEGTNFGEEAEGEGVRRKLLSITHNNLACWAQRAKKPQEALLHLEYVMSLEYEEGGDAQKGVNTDPTTLLNLCAVLCDMKRYGDGVLAARRAVVQLQRALYEVLAEDPPPAGPLPQVPRVELYISALHNLGTCQLRLRQRGGDQASSLDLLEGFSSPERVRLESVMERSEGDHALDTVQLAATMSRRLLGKDHPMSVKTAAALTQAERMCHGSGGKEGSTSNTTLVSMRRRDYRGSEGRSKTSLR